MPETFSELKTRITTPVVIAEKDPYMIKFAITEDEITDAQKLRYDVFNVEQGKGLETANSNGIDRDEYDDVSVHLVVTHKESDKAVGTYRIILSQQANKDMGLYSEREYDISGLCGILPQTLEVGRSCVSPEYRNGTVVALLWAGFSEIMARSGMRYLFGCVSLEDTRPAAGWALYEHFIEQGYVSDSINAVPRNEFELAKPPREEIDAILSDKAQMRELFPPLLKGYLRMGSKICGIPAYDYEFGTIDYLIILDVANLPERYSKHFNVKVAGV